MGTIVNRGTKGDPKYYVMYRDVDGRRKMRNSRQPTKAKAAQFLAAAEARVANGLVGIEELKVEGTFSELADYWLATHSKVQLSSHDANASRMEQHLRPAFGKQPLSWITAERIDEFAAKMVRETVTDPETKKERPRWSPSTINRCLALLRKVLNDGVRWGRISHPPRVRLLPVPEQAFDFLAREEAERLLSHTRSAAANDYPLYATAIYCGLRMGELYGLQWRDVDLERGVMTVRRSYQQPYTKSKKVRRVRMNKQLALILKDWQRVCPAPPTPPGQPAAEPLVFPRTDGTMRMREKPPVDFAAHLAAARCHAITFHDLRHTAASLMVMAGASLRFVQQQLGHSTIVVTEKYAHLSPDFVAAEADRVSLDLQNGLGQIVALDGGASGP
jgi:integrase